MKYIVGLGNYSMGDDSIGIRVVEHIAQQGLETGFQALNISCQPLNLVTYLNENTEAMVIVDCLKTGKRPSDWILFTPEQVATQKELAGFSTHEGDALKTLELFKAAGYSLPKVRILGIEPQSLEVNTDLSPSLESRLPEYVQLAIREIESM